MIEDCTLTGAVLFLLLEKKARTAMWRACCCLRDGGVEAMSVAQVRGGRRSASSRCDRVDNMGAFDCGALDQYLGKTTQLSSMRKV